jgi:hypothetical protein
MTMRRGEVTRLKLFFVEVAAFLSHPWSTQDLEATVCVDIYRKDQDEVSIAMADASCSARFYEVQKCDFVLGLEMVVDGDEAILHATCKTTP